MISNDVRVVLHVRGSVFAVCVLVRLLLSVPVFASLNETRVQDVQELKHSMCDVSPSAGCRGGWDYGPQIGPEHWPGVCTSGQHQSPVDLDKEAAKTAHWEPLVFFLYRNVAPMTVTNTGHSIFVQVTDKCPRALGAGGLGEVYSLLALHFHWTSEHMISGRRFPLELHFAHLKWPYKSESEARKDARGLAYLAIFFEETPEDNAALGPLLEAVKSVGQVKDSSAEVAEFSLASLLPRSTSTFFRYEGSLTTPDCDEIVVWTILKDTVPISTAQLKIFTDIREPQTKRYNKRPMQALNDRTVYLRTSVASRTLRQGILATLLVTLSLHL